MRQNMSCHFPLWSLWSLCAVGREGEGFSCLSFLPKCRAEELNWDVFLPAVCFFCAGSRVQPSSTARHVSPFTLSLSLVSGRDGRDITFSFLSHFFLSCRFPFPPSPSSSGFRGDPLSRSGASACLSYHLSHALTFIRLFISA